MNSEEEEKQDNEDNNTYKTAAALINYTYLMNGISFSIILVLSSRYSFSHINQVEEEEEEEERRRRRDRSSHPSIHLAMVEFLIG